MGCASAILEADCQDLACAFTVTEVLDAVKKTFVDEESAKEDAQSWECP